MKDWILKINAAMKDLHDACKENTSQYDCELCPFHEICDFLSRNDYQTPENWDHCWNFKK